MSKHLQRDLEHLKKQILGVGSIVEEAINHATSALIDRRIELAQEVVAGDDLIDAREVAVEEECLKVLALHQPVATDLRFIVAVLKVNNDLERMGDLAVNIAERALYLASHKALRPLPNFELMVTRVREMVRNSLDALVNLDTALADKVCKDDDEIDRLNRQMFVELQELMHESPDTIERAVQTLSACRHLERIADQATNIAEDVLFLVQGEIHRHRHGQRIPPRGYLEPRPRWSEGTPHAGYPGAPR
jgi:phosphate transport system protein